MRMIVSVDGQDLRIDVQSGNVWTVRVENPEGSDVLTIDGEVVHFEQGIYGFYPARRLDTDGLPHGSMFALFHDGKLYNEPPGTPGLSIIS